MRPKLSELAQVCQLTYDTTFSGQQWNIGDIHVIAQRIDKYLVVAFRGTRKDGEDILRDLRFMPWWARAVGFGPSGFLKGARALISESSFLADVSADLKAGTLIVTGHSLGGAMAFITAAWLVWLGFALAGAYGFEPARCGGFKMRRLWRKIPMILWTHDGNDEVPYLPIFYFLPKMKVKIGVSHFDWFRCHRIGTVITDLKAKNL